MTATATESRKVLIDNTGPIKLSLTESEEDKKLYAEGKIGQCGVATANGRVYTEAVMRREVGKLQPRIEQASLYSAVDHPGDGKSRIMNSGGIVRALRVENNGEIFGKFEIVEETDCGRNLAALLRRGGTVGVSSRGLGSTSTNETGQEVVGEDFRLVSFDFVLDPAVQTAYPTFFSEDVDLEQVTEEHIRGKFPKIVEAIEKQAYDIASQTTYEAVRSDVESDVERALSESRDKLRDEFKAELYPEVVKELKEDFGTKLIRATAEIRKEVEEVVRSEFAADPTVAGAKMALEQVAKIVVPFSPPPDAKQVIDEKDAKIEELTKGVTELEKQIERVQNESEDNAGKARDFGWRLYVEKALAGRDDAETLRGMIGDLNNIATAEDLKSKVESCIAAADKALEEAKTRLKAEQTVQDLIEQKKADLNGRRTKKLEERDNLLRDKVRALEEELNRIQSERTKDLQELKEENKGLRRRLNGAGKIADKLKLENYGSARLAGHPRQLEIMRGIQDGRIRSMSEVDTIANDTDINADEVGAQERIRHFLGKGREFMPEEQRKKKESLTESRQTPIPGMEDFDISVEEIKKLSGGSRRR